MLDLQQTVADCVLDHSECAAVFQRHHIDFCCRGDLSIEAAGERAGIDAAALLEELQRTIHERSRSNGDPRALSTPALIHQIVAKHHGYLRATLPFVRALAVKVSRVHGGHNPRLQELEALVDELNEVLRAHLDEEEDVLFPAMLADPPAESTPIARALATMEDEHLAVGSLLRRIRSTTEEFALPDWACNSYRTLFSELEQLESDVFKHVHLENHVLMPRFAAP
jgi:regulator of cell morphogenesis and NO signaling